MRGWILVISLEEAAMAREKGNTGLRGGNGIYHFRSMYHGRVKGLYAGLNQQPSFATGELQCTMKKAPS